MSYAIGDRFTAGEFAPWLMFPGLVALFFILSPRVWLRALLYATAGLIAAHVAMGLLGFERHGMMSHAGHHSTTVVLHVLFEVSVDIALALGFVAMLKRIAPHTYEGNIIATYDVERVLNWRLAAVLLALPFYVFAMRYIEAVFAGAVFGTSFEAWPVLGADLVGYFMFLPAILGIVLALTGAPRLEPDYQPLNVLVVGYIALVGVLTGLGVLFGPHISTISIIAPFGVESSNIQRLQDYPIDIVKIDRSLIREVAIPGPTRKMVGSLAALLKSLELAVTVEGIETQEQADILNDFGLVIHQGYLYGKPVPPEQLGVQTAE